MGPKFFYDPVYAVFFKNIPFSQKISGIEGHKIRHTDCEPNKAAGHASELRFPSPIVFEGFAEPVDLFPDSGKRLISEITGKQLRKRSKGKCGISGLLICRLHPVFG